MTQASETAASATVLLPISEAAPRLRLHPSALRSRIRRGVMEARRGNAGQFLVEVPADAQPAPDTPMASAEDELALENDALRRELEAARLALVRAEGERDTAAATADARVEAAERLIAELRAMLEANRAELAEARRPWWRRLLAG